MLDGLADAPDTASCLFTVRFRAARRFERRDMRIIAIDPGKQGAIAWLDTEVKPFGSALTFHQLPLDDDNEWDAWAMTHLVEQWIDLLRVERVVIEECHAFPGGACWPASRGSRS